MKKSFLIAVSLCSINAATFAQDLNTQKSTETITEDGLKTRKQRPTVEQRVQKNVDRLNAMVTLTEEQKPKVRELAATKIKKADEVREKYKKDETKKEIKESELKVIKQEYNKNVKALLTQEQLTVLKMKQKELKAIKKSDELDAD